MSSPTNSPAPLATGAPDEPMSGPPGEAKRTNTAPSPAGRAAVFIGNTAPDGSHVPSGSRTVTSPRSAPPEPGTASILPARTPTRVPSRCPSGATASTRPPGPTKWEAVRRMLPPSAPRSANPVPKWCPPHPRRNVARTAAASASLRGWPPKHPCRPVGMRDGRVPPPRNREAPRRRTRRKTRRDTRTRRRAAAPLIAPPRQNARHRHRRQWWGS